MAQSPLVLTPNQGEYPLGLFWELLTDPTGQLTITEVASPEYASRFQPSQEIVPNFGYTQAAHWARLRLINDTPADCLSCRDWLLELTDPTIDSVELYLIPLPATGAILTKRGGDLLPFSSREVNHPHLVFPLALPPQQAYDLYLRLQNQGSTLFRPPSGLPQLLLKTAHWKALVMAFTTV